MRLLNVSGISRIIVWCYMLLTMKRKVVAVVLWHQKMGSDIDIFHGIVSKLENPVL